MKALLQTGYGKPRPNLKISDYDKPKAGHGEVLIEVHAASVNPVDYKIIKGNLKTIRNPKLPAPIGFDVSGVVCEVGEGVGNFKVGDEVYSSVDIPQIGTIAEYVAAQAEHVALKPKKLSHSEAATIPLVGLTAYQAIVGYLNLQEGQKILIHAGSGGVGSFAIQLAKSMGAFVATTTSTRNTELVKQLGADLVIDYTKENYIEVIKDYDAVLDTLGGIYAYDALKVVKKNGQVVSIAGPKDAYSIRQITKNKLIEFLFWMGSRRIKFNALLRGASYRYLLLLTDGMQLSEITTMIENNKIKPVLEKVFPFSQSIEAFEHVYSGRTRGKIAIAIK